MSTILNRPRRLDLNKTFRALIDWIKEKSTKERAPGLLVSISGTDSILTFLACARAFEELGKAEKILGLNFEHVSHNELTKADQPFVCVKSPFNWVASEIYPWLRDQAPAAKLEIDNTISHSDDNKRWGHVLSRAVHDADARQGLHTEHYFVVGTRNATEEALGTYSQVSKSVSMLPIINLFKSEVLELCQYLDVPQIAIDKSREIDCDCGRFDTQANHMRELDLYIMYKQGLLSREYLKNAMPNTVLNAVTEFYAEETYNNRYRAATPYRPDFSLVVPR